MEPKKRVVRRRPRTRHEDGWRCGCGKLTVHLGTEKVVVLGDGWCKKDQWIVCGGCNDEVRFAPLLVWQTGSGSQYTTRGYVGAGESRQIL